MICAHLTIIVAVLLGLAVPAAGTEVQNSEPLTFDLAVSFDLDAKLVRGTGRLAIAAGQDLELELAGLTPTAVLLSSPSRENAELDLGGREVLRLSPSAEPRTLMISWEKKVEDSFENLLSDQVIILTSNWHPVVRQRALFSIQAQVPPGFIAVSQADLFREPDDQGRVQFSFSQPLHALSFGAAPWLRREQPVREGLTIHTLFFEEDQDLAAGYLEAAAGYVRRYEQLIGPLPYNHYLIVENPMATGYGFPTFTLLGRQVIRLPFIKDTSLGHEILHSWFGNSIGIAEGSGNWSEGLTTYLADMAYRSEAGEGAAARKEAIDRYLSYVKDDTPALQHFYGAGHDRPGNQAERAVGYQRAAMLFHELAQLLGDDLFHAALRRFYGRHKGTPASWADLQRSFEEESGRALDSFFASRLSTTVLPDIDLDGVRVEQNGSDTFVSLNVSQKQTPVQELLLPVVVHTLAGPRTFQGLIGEANDTLRFQVDSTPLEVVLDPDYHLMRRLSPAEQRPLWSTLMGDAGTLVVVPEDEAETYRPLVELAGRYGWQVGGPAELSQQDLEQRSVIFLGQSDPHLRRLFGDPAHPASGFTVDVRPNPFNDRQAMAIVSSSAVEESSRAVGRLSHYGKYSYLHFQGGKAVELRVPETVAGIRAKLEEKPAGLALPALGSFEQLADELAAHRVVYIGEAHTSRPDHLLQLMLIEALHTRHPNLAIGLEMFPRSSQPALDRFIQDPAWPESDFLRESKYFQVWGYDYRLFRPIFAYARRHGIPLLGLNIDRDVVSTVFRDGSLESLSAEQRAQLPAEMRLDLEGYVERLTATHRMHGGIDQAAGGLPGFIRAQAMWDETMAESISTYLGDHPDTLLVVLAGSQHTRKDSGIPPRVAARIAVDQASVANQATSRLTGAELARTADYLFLLEAAEFGAQGKIGVVLQERSGDTPTRLAITDISPGSNAEAAGLRRDDLLIFIDELAIHTMDDVRLALLDKAAGETVRVSVLRKEAQEERRLDLEVQLYQPDPPPGHP